MVQWGKVAEFKKDLADCRKKPNAYFGYAVSFNIPVSEDAIEQFVEDARISRVRADGWWWGGRVCGVMKKRETVCVCLSVFFSLVFLKACVDCCFLIRQRIYTHLILPFPPIHPPTMTGGGRVRHRRRGPKKKHHRPGAYSTCARFFGFPPHHVVVDRNVRVVDKEDRRRDTHSPPENAAVSEGRRRR